MYRNPVNPTLPRGLPRTWDTMGDTNTGLGPGDMKRGRNGTSLDDKLVTGVTGSPYVLEHVDSARFESRHPVTAVRSVEVSEESGE